MIPIAKFRFEVNQGQRQVSDDTLSTSRCVNSVSRRQRKQLIAKHQEKYQKQFPPNIVRNQKYNVFTFLPIVLYEQFKFFFNLYFLLVALSQFVPQLRIGEFCGCIHTRHTRFILTFFQASYLLMLSH